MDTKGMTKHSNDIPKHRGLNVDRARASLCVEGLKIILERNYVTTEGLIIDVSTDVPGSTELRIGWEGSRDPAANIRMKQQAEKATAFLEKYLPSAKTKDGAMVFASPRMLATALNGIAERQGSPEKENTLKRDLTELSDRMLGSGRSVT